jgi:hypothetical protein
MKKIKKQPPVKPERSETPVSQFAMSFGMNRLAHIARRLKKLKQTPGRSVIPVSQVRSFVFLIMLKVASSSWDGENVNSQ